MILKSKAVLLGCTLVVLLISCTRSSAAGNTPVWTSTGAADLPRDYQAQGEYAAAGWGAQIIALGDGHFQGVVFRGGLPGDGWDGEHRSLIQGEWAGEDTVQFVPATGSRRYLDADPARFSASATFPPKGQESWEGSLAVKSGELKLVGPEGRKILLTHRIRKSPTLGAHPIEGAQVLFDGQGTDAFKGGRLDPETRLLNTDGKDILTLDKYTDYQAHVEFMLPFRPHARGQARGNSGFYQLDHYEVQVLDSFGLEGRDNECGGIYQKARPKPNMCFPPLTWQTYDVEFYAAKVDASGKKIQNARITLRHNGVLIYDNLEINGTTGGSRKDPEGTPGPLKFQGHGNPLQYRNIWVKPL